MARPRNKADLIVAATENFEKLVKMIVEMSDEEKAKDFDFSEDEAKIDYEGEYSKELEGTTINVFNWGEYIPDGTEGSLDINKEFTKLTGIKVNYTTYESNEAMYSKLKGGGVSYDIIIPSDYMIERMINEGMIQELDFSNIPNYNH